MFIGWLCRLNINNDLGSIGYWSVSLKLQGNNYPHTFNKNIIYYNKSVRVMIVTASINYTSAIPYSADIAKLPEGYTCANGAIIIGLKINDIVFSNLSLSCFTNGIIMQNGTSSSISSIEFYGIIPNIIEN